MVNDDLRMSGGVADLALSVILASDTPLLLLSADTTVLAASQSFCLRFGITPARATLVPLSQLGQGEWASPQLAALLKATASSRVLVKNYEMDLRRADHSVMHLLINAQQLNQASDSGSMVLLSINDVTETRRLVQEKDLLVQEKAVLLQELQHRIANSLQIVASVLLQSARTVQSPEARSHLTDAHHRVMSVAALQHQLALSQAELVDLGPYLSTLCRSIGASMIRDPSLLALEVRVENGLVAANVSLSVGLIVTELVINALKHAFPEQRAGEIVVSYVASPAGWTLAVADNGVGMTSDSDDPKAGLGSSIVTALVAQLDAEIAISSANPGTMVSVEHHAAIDGEAVGRLGAV